MILGNRCTRSCRFCGVHKQHPEPVEPDEPRRVASAAAELGLRHVVITSVTRDDLKDGGASVFAQTICAVRETNPQAGIEVLVPDFLGNRDSVSAVLNAAPDVFNHNLETIQRMVPAVRPEADYHRSLEVLRQAADSRLVIVKSGIMIGLGEEEEELTALFQDLVSSGTQVLTIGQYLSPSRRHYPVKKMYHPDEFKRLEELARAAGLTEVVAGTYVRSSYRARQTCARLQVGK